MTSIRDTSLIASVRAMCASGEARQRRIDGGLHIGEMASAVGADPATVWRWENGKRSPRGERAVRYAKILASLEARS